MRILTSKFTDFHDTRSRGLLHIQFSMRLGFMM